MKNKLINAVNTVCTEWVPLTLVLGFLLTLTAAALSFLFTASSPWDILAAWNKGFWNLLTFAMQMALLMMTGFIIADSPPVARLIKQFVGLAKTPVQAIVHFSLFSGLIWWLHWGVGMMVGIVLGQHYLSLRRDLKLDPRFVAAIAYSGIVLINGPSKSPPLLLATAGHFLEKTTGIIPVTLTTFSPMMLLLAAVLWVLTPLILVHLRPRPYESMFENDDGWSSYEVIPNTVAEKLNRTSWFTPFIYVPGLLFCIHQIATNGLAILDINNLNFFYLMLGLMLHRNAHAFMESAKRATPMLTGVILQFPFYGGIFGILTYTGLAAAIASWFLAFSNNYTFGFVAIWFSGLMAVFIPSGGSKFVVEAPFIFPAAKQLGFPLQQAMNSLSIGHVLMLLIHPFWCLPILCTFKVRFYDVVPYTFVLFVAGVAVAHLALFVQLLF